jgi:metal-responsive CopG/Arc/MetJ family transcriptional regulator
MVREKGYRNRSQAISDMVRDHLAEHRQEMTDSEVAGTITLVYDHHRPHVQETLTNLQHKRLRRWSIRVDCFESELLIVSFMLIARSQLREKIYYALFMPRSDVTN